MLTITIVDDLAPKCQGKALQFSVYFGAEIVIVFY